MKAYVLNVEDDDRPPAGEAYRFRGARGNVAWPVGSGARLGSCGIWNFLWRLGVNAIDCSLDSLPPPGSAIVWASAEASLNPQRLAGLRNWMNSGGYVVATGDGRVWADVLGWRRDDWASTHGHHPYAGIAAVMPGRSAGLVAPPRWSFSTCQSPPHDARVLGSLHHVNGERQTPGRALLSAVVAPAIVAGRQYCFLNGAPFAALQAWLQGQEDLQPWLAWRHRLFWLDEWVSAMAMTLAELPALPADLPRPGIKGLGATTVVLRHDVDHSRDVAYLEEETRRRVPATYAVLRDGNTAFWRDALGGHPDHECALHYNTGGRDWLREGRTRLRGQGAAPLQPRRADVTGDGLLRQVRWAQSQRVGVASLHRHLFFQVYPEWVDALDHVFESEAAVHGASSMFRAQVLRWGAERVDGVAGTVGEWPDPQYPFWLPYKLANAARGGQRLRGWETASVMECEPEFVDQLLRHPLPHLPQRVVTIGYHPAHAKGTTFHESGSFDTFTRVLDVITSHRTGIERADRVFALANAAVA